MKKILISLFFLLAFCSNVFADCSIEKQNLNKKAPCDKCALEEDDEYCIYNECFFDKHFIKMKKALCLTRQQEAIIDNLYKNFKVDMENIHINFRTEKNKLLVMIDCDNDCYKNQVKALKKTGKDAKERCKIFQDDIKEQLCKNQYSDFRRFRRFEKRKFKKIAKYGKIIKLPCTDCCSQCEKY